MNKPIAVDLYGCQGGMAGGLKLAGFYTVGVDIEGDGIGVENRPSGHLLDTGGAGAGEAERPHPEAPHVPHPIPVELDPVAAPTNRLRDHISSHQQRSRRG